MPSVSEGLSEHLVLILALELSTAWSFSYSDSEVRYADLSSCFKECGIVCFSSLSEVWLSRLILRSTFMLLCPCCYTLLVAKSEFMFVVAAVESEKSRPLSCYGYATCSNGVKFLAVGAPFLLALAALSD